MENCEIPDEQQVFDAMQKYGGSFVAALSEAWRRADKVNSARLHIAFAYYYVEYAEMVKRDLTAA